MPEDQVQRCYDKASQAIQRLRCFLFEKSKT